MRRSTTLILLALAASLCAWMLLREGSTPRDLSGHFLFDLSASLSEKEELKVDVEAGQVAGIDLKSSVTEISLRKSPDGIWELTKGVKDRADESIVKELLDYTAKARIADIIGSSELKAGNVSAASLGLDDASAWRVTWLRADGSSLAELRVGKTAPLDNAAYVQMLHEDRRPDIYLVHPDLRPLLARPLDSFRDPRVSRYSSAEVQRMVVRKGEGEVEFSRASVHEEDGAPWVISRPLPNAPANQAAVKDFVAMICGAKMEGWAAYSETTGTGAAGDKPVVEVTLIPAQPDAKGATLSFFPDPAAPEKTAICRDVQRKASFRVAKQIMDDLCLAESPNLFRSRKLAAIDPAIVSTVQVTSGSGEAIIACRVAEKWSWRPLGGGAFADADPERPEKLIKLLNETEITDFASDSLSDPAAFGLDKPAMTITIGAGTHSSLERLTPLTEKNSQTLRIGNPPNGRIFANFAGEPFVYQIGPELPGGVPLSGLKWRSLTLPGFSAFQVRGLKQSLGTDPPIELKYDPLAFKWSAQRAGADVTALLIPGLPESFAMKLGSLRAAAWLENATAAEKALESPAVSLEVQFESYDDNPNKSHITAVKLDLAPLPAGINAPFGYGRLSSVRDAFLIDSRVLRDMSATLLRKNP